MIEQGEHIQQQTGQPASTVAPSSRWGFSQFKLTGLLKFALVLALVIPLACAGILVSAFSDPAGGLRNVPAAVVNLDAGAQLDGEDVSYGQKLCDYLVESNANGAEGELSGFAWDFVSADEAAEGLNNGSYLLSLVIPEGFSQAAVSAASGDLKPAVIEVKVNPAAGYAAADLGAALSARIASHMGFIAGSDVLNSIFLNVDELAGDVAQSGDGVAEVGIGLGTASSAAGQLASGVEQLESGSAELANGLGTVSQGVSQLADGAGDLADGSAQLSDGISQIGSGISQLAQGLQESSAASTQLTQLLTAIGADLANQDLDAAGQKAQQLQATLGPNLSIYIAQQLASTSVGYVQAGAAFQQAVAAYQQALAAGNYPAAIAAAGTMAQAGGQLNDAALAFGEAKGLCSGYMAGLQDMGQYSSAGMATLADAVAQLDQGVNGQDGIAAGAQALAAGAAGTASGASSLAQGLAPVREGARTITYNLGVVASGAGELAAGISQSISTVNGFADDIAAGTEDIEEAVSSASERSELAAEPVTGNLRFLSDMAGFGTGIAPFALALGLWLGSIMAVLIIRPLRHRTVSAGKNAVVTALAGFAPLALIAAIQSLAAAALLQFALGVSPAHGLFFYIFALLAGLSCMAAAYFLRSLLGTAGTVLTLLLAVVQAALCGGVMPLQASGGLFALAGLLLPMTHMVAGLRAALMGLTLQPALVPALVSLGLLVVFLLLTALVARYRAKHVRSGAHSNRMEVTDGR